MKDLSVYAVLLCALCVAPVAFAEKVKTRGVDYACVKIVDLAKVKKAQRLGQAGNVANFMKRGCFVTLPRWRLNKVDEWGLAVQVEGSPKDFGFQNTPGMEKIRKIKVWMHKDNIR
ncbi:MAG: hypothetical protein OSB62_08165 [Alphaproteobacteria bacterium]|nr:hypothetical protein [Alphaproteobacteria bacterium]